MTVFIVSAGYPPVSRVYFFSLVTKHVGSENPVLALKKLQSVLERWLSG